MQIELQAFNAMKIITEHGIIYEVNDAGDLGLRLTRCDREDIVVWESLLETRIIGKTHSVVLDRNSRR